MATIAKTVLLLWVGAALCYIFLILPPAQGFASPELARVVTLHLPNAYVAVIAAMGAGWWGLRYLIGGRKKIDDARSMIFASLAALFCFLTTITGSVFANVQWGAYWNWDPRETSVFVLLLVYAAYFLLRAGIEDEEKRASVGAVYILFASIMTPLLGYLIPAYLAKNSLHPKNATFDASYRMAIYLGMTVGLLGMLGWLQNIAVRYERARLALVAAFEDE